MFTRFEYQWKAVFSTALFLIVQGAFFSVFWMQPAFASYDCYRFSEPNPDPIVWLPFKTVCSGHNMPPLSGHDFWNYDLHSDDLPNCAEVVTQAYLVISNVDQPVGCETVTREGTGVTPLYQETFPLVCNYSEGYHVFQQSVDYFRFFDTYCTGYPFIPSADEAGFGGKDYIKRTLGFDEVVPEKNRGLPKCGLSAGNPINIATGNKYQQDVDVTLPGGLEIIRHYNSDDKALHSFGIGWHGGFTRKIEAVFIPDNSRGSITVIRDDGRENYWQYENTSLIAPPDASGQLEIIYNNGSISSFMYTSDNNSIETYDVSGKLLSINAAGQILYFTYTNSLLTMAASS